MALLLLSGCAFGPFDTDHLLPMPPPDSAFDEALSAEYVRLGDAERAEYDWVDTARFYRRATDARAGLRVEPEALDARDLTAEDRAVLGPARDRLMRALLDGARALAPAAAARAQAGFDCWMQEQEEGHQPDDIVACRDAYDSAMAEVEAALDGALVVLLADAAGDVGAIDLTSPGGTVTLAGERESAVVADASAPAPAGTLGERDVREIFAGALAAEPPVPVTFRLYFETGTDQLVPASRNELPVILQVIRERLLPGVEIAGHTDRVGAADVNYRLALRRAELVRQAVLELGLSDRLIRVDSFGEQDPVVPTADGVAEPLNRRVEITVR